MIKTFRWQIAMDTSISMNGFLYFLRKIPFIGKILGSDRFHYPEEKKFLAVVSFLLSIAKTIFNSALGFGIMFLFIWVLLAGDMMQIKEKIQIAIFFLYFCFGVTGSKVIEKHKNNFYNICVFKVNPTSLGLSLSLMQRLIQCFGRSIIFILLLPIFKINMLFALLISLMILGGQLMGEAAHLWIFEKSRKTLNLSNVYIVLRFILITILAVVFLKYTVVGNVFTQPIFIGTVIILTVLSLYYLVHYKYYTEAFLKVARREFYDVEEVMKDVTFANVKLKDSDLKLAQDESQTGKVIKTGYPYLNALFFKRHRRMLMKPALIKSGIIALLFLVGLVYGLIFDGEEIKIAIETLTQGYSIVPFIIYILCNSERITRAMFLNCDFSLMRFGFYKEKRALLKMFTLRLRDVSLINAIVTLTLTIGLMTLTYIFASKELMSMLLISLMIIILGIFFTVHYLFIYYLFQPYTEDLKVKSPMYGILKGLVYIICYMFMVAVDSPKIIFLPAIIISAVIYIIIALILVYTKAPKTFRVK